MADQKKQKPDVKYRAMKKIHPFVLKFQGFTAFLKKNFCASKAGQTAKPLGLKQYGFAYITAKDLNEAQKIARACLNQKLCACANIFPGMHSCYEWEGQYKEEPEAVLILKTRRDLFKELREKVLSLHSYTCPCIVFIPVAEGHTPFLSWMDSQMSVNISR